MLAITPSRKKDKTLTPNLLPCSIKHNGPINTATRYWSPSTSADGTQTSFFRGRKLLGRTVAIPEGYEGTVLAKTDKLVQEKPNAAAQAAMEGDGDEEDTEMIARQEVETKVMEQQGRFEEVVVWGHEAVPEDEDLYVKGMQEWVGFAEAVSYTRVCFP